MEAFHRARHAVERAGERAVQSREVRMDAARRIDVVRREHRALIERAEEAIRNSGQLLAPRRAGTAIVAHRQEWFTRKIGAVLAERGILVLGHTDVGADAVGWAIAEQPDLVVVEDSLAMVTGEQAVREIRQYCERTVIGAQVPYSDRVAPMLDAGADVVHVRAVPPVQVVEELLALVAG
jgi:hypothetical protein